MRARNEAHRREREKAELVVKLYNQEAGNYADRREALNKNFDLEELQEMAEGFGLDIGPELMQRKSALVSILAEATGDDKPTGPVGYRKAEPISGTDSDSDSNIEGMATFPERFIY